MWVALPPWQPCQWYHSTVTRHSNSFRPLLPPILPPFIPVAFFRSSSEMQPRLTVCRADFEALRRMLTMSIEANADTDGCSSSFAPTPRSLIRPEMEQQGEQLAPLPSALAAHGDFAVAAQASSALLGAEGDLSESLEEQLEIARQGALRWRSEARELQQDNYGLGHDVWALNAAVENAEAMNQQLHRECAVLGHRCTGLAHSLERSEAARDSLAETEGTLRQDLAAVTSEFRAATLRMQELEGALSASRIERMELMQSLDESESGRSSHCAAIRKSQMMQACIVRQAETVHAMLDLLATAKLEAAEQAKVTCALELEVCDLRQQLEQRQRALERLESANVSLRSGLTPERSWQDEQADTPFGDSDGESSSTQGDEPQPQGGNEVAALIAQNAHLAARAAEVTARLGLLEARSRADADERDASQMLVASLQVRPCRIVSLVLPAAYQCSRRLPSHPAMALVRSRTHATRKRICACSND